MKDIFPPFLLDRIYLKFGDEQFTFKNLKEYLTKVHRIPNKIAVYLIFDLVDRNYLKKENKIIKINKNILNKVNKELELVYIESNKKLLNICNVNL